MSDESDVRAKDVVANAIRAARYGEVAYEAYRDHIQNKVDLGGGSVQALVEATMVSFEELPREIQRAWCAAIDRVLEIEANKTALDS